MPTRSVLSAPTTGEAAARAQRTPSVTMDNLDTARVGSPVISLLLRVAGSPGRAAGRIDSAPPPALALVTGEPHAPGVVQIGVDDIGHDGEGLRVDHRHR